MSRLIISERQLLMLETTLKENADHDIILNNILDDINSNYEMTNSTYRQGGEYFNKPMIKIKIDGEMITPKDLLSYLKYKYKVSDAFLKQVILDWVNGNDKLTKNISLKSED